MGDDDIGRRRFLQAAGLFGASATLGGVIVPPASADTLPEPAASVPPGHALVWGHVFADRNGDGQVGHGDHGLRGVAVSDGATVVVTDGLGRFALPVDPARRDSTVVFVSVPAGWSARPDAEMIPQFYRRLDVVAGDRIRVDFGLKRDRHAEDASYRFLAISDPHVRPTPGSFPFDTDPLGRWLDQVGQFNELGAVAAPDDAPRFMTVSGDLTEWGLATEFAAFRTGTATSAVPVWPVIGNHEYRLAWWTDPAWNYAGNVAEYRRSLGPEWYSFDYGRQHFVVLDDMLGVGQPDQLRWLERDLAIHAPGRDIVLVFHAPFAEIDDWIARYYPDHPAVTQTYLDVLEPYDVSLMLSGHAHVNRVDRRLRPGTAHVNSTSTYYSLDQTPLGFRVVKVEHRRPPRARFRMLGVEAALTLVHPGPDAELPPGPVTMQASAYRTTATVRSARYRVDDGPWRPLRGSGDWTWAADHDFRGTASGPHEWQVQVEDDAGRSWERSSSFTIVPELSPAVPMAGAAWPMFHGDPARSGASTDAVSPPLRLAWSHRSDGSILTGSPVVAGTTVYVGVRDEDGDDRCGLAAVDLATGSRRWWSPARSMVDATPAVAGDLVHTTSVDGMLQAHDTRTGQPVWEHRADDDDALAYVSAYGSLAVADGVVLSGYRTYRHDGGRQASVISARDALTGAERWSFTSAFFYQVNDHKAVAVGGGRVYVNPGLNPPWGIDLQSGARTWSARLTLPAGDRPLEFGQGPVVVTDSLVLTTYRDSVSKGPNAVVAFDVGSGDEVWRYLGPAEVLAFSDLDGTAPAVSGDTVYAALASGAVVALDLATGAERWRRDLGTALLSSPAVSGTTIYVGGNDGVLYALDSSAGDVTWSYQLGSWVASSPAVSGNTVVVGAWDGNLYAFVGEPA